jgi:hypothetical protein
MDVHQRQTEDSEDLDGVLAESLPAFATPTRSAWDISSGAVNRPVLQLIALTTTIPVSIFPSSVGPPSDTYHPTYHNLGDGSLVTDLLSSSVHRASADVIISSMVLVIFARNTVEALRHLFQRRRYRADIAKPAGPPSAWRGTVSSLDANTAGIVMMFSLFGSQVLGVTGTAISLRRSLVSLADPLTAQTCRA